MVDAANWRTKQRCICGVTNAIEQRTDEVGRISITLRHGDGEAQLTITEGEDDGLGVGGVGSRMSDWLHDVHRYERGKREEVA